MATILLVVGDKAALTAGDTFIQGRITAAGHSVTLRSDEEAEITTGYDGIWASDSCSAGTLAAKYGNVAKPAISSEFPVWGFGTNGNLGVTTSWNVIAGTALSAGLSGAQTVYPVSTFQDGTTAGTGGAGMVTVAEHSAGASIIPVAYWESGTAMADRTAPARRVLFRVGSSIGDISTAARAIMDAAIGWAYGSAGATGALAASMPSATAAVAGNIVDPAAIAAAMPSATAAVDGVVVDQGVLAATMPAATAAVDGTLLAGAVLAAEMPAAQASITGNAVDGNAIQAFMPAAQASITAIVVDAGELLAGMPAATAALPAVVSQPAVLTASMPAAAAALLGEVPVPDLLRLNGLDIRRHAHRPRDISTLLRVPAKRGGDLVIPGAHGERRIPGKLYQAGLAALTLIVMGVDPDTGLVPALSTARREFYRRMDELIEAIGDEDLLISYTRPTGEEREIRGEVLDVLDPRAEPPGILAELDVVLTLADPFWRDVVDVATGRTITGTTGVTTQLTGYAGATAPMEDLLLEFGPCSNPRLEQPATGVWVAWSGIIGAGQTLRIYTHDDEWRVAGTGGLTVTPADYVRLSYGGPSTRRWFAMRPEAGGPTLRLTHTGGGSATATVTGRRKYKTA